MFDKKSTSLHKSKFEANVVLLRDSVHHTPQNRPLNNVQTHASTQDESSLWMNAFIQKKTKTKTNHTFLSPH